LATVGSFGRRIKQLFGEEIAKNRIEIVEAFEVLERAVDPGLGPPEKERAKCFEKRCAGCHLYLAARGVPFAIIAA